MPIRIKAEKNNKGNVSTIFVCFSDCPPEVISAFLSGFPLYKFSACLNDEVIYSANFISERAALTNTFALCKFRDMSEGICKDYEDFMDEGASWEDRLYAARRKYSDLRSNVSELRKRLSEVSQSAYGAGKLTMELADELARVELDMDRLRAKIAVASF